MEKQVHEANHRRKKGSKKMVDSGITITMDRFAELIRKEVAYDIKARDVANKLHEDSYVSELDEKLFIINPLKEGE